MSESAAAKTQLIAGEKAQLQELVRCQPGAVVSRTLLKQPTGTVTLFAFDADQGLSEHSAAFDALVHVLSGEAEITIGGKPTLIAVGEAILLPANIPHALSALTPFTMLLTMLRA